MEHTWPYCKGGKHTWPRKPSWGTFNGIWDVTVTPCNDCPAVKVAQTYGPVLDQVVAVTVVEAR